MANPPADGPEPRDAPKEIVTQTGWRIVGRAMDLVSETARAGLRPPATAELLFAATFRLRPRLGANAVNAVIAALDTALRRTWTDLPPLRHDESAQRTAGRMHAMHWDQAGDRERWAAELLWRHPHPTVSGAQCTTQLVISEQTGSTSLGVRVGTPGGAASVRGMVGAAEARPAWLADVARATQLAFHGHPTDPTTLDDDAIDRFVGEVLLSEARDYPVAVLAPAEAGGYLVPPDEIANELLGVAPLFVLARHPTTFRLTDALGDRRLSAYWGALRVYRPGFSCADWSSDHPLLRNDVVGDPVIRAETIGALAVRAASQLAPLTGVDAIREAEHAPRATSGASAVAQAQSSGKRVASEPAGVATPGAATAATAAPAPASLPTDVSQRLAELSGAVARLGELSGILYAEVLRLRTTSAVRAASTSSLERRLGRIDELLRDRFAPTAPESDAPPPDAPVNADSGEADDAAGAIALQEVVRQAGVAFADSLLVLDAAERSAEDSPYEDVDRAAVVLEAMALVCQRRREGMLGVSLREAFREVGIDYRRSLAESTSKKLRQQYQVRGPGGIVYDCDEHIVLGSSYDPRHCLRIYFTSRAPNESRFVVGHVGRHFDVKTTT